MRSPPAEKFMRATPLSLPAWEKLAGRAEFDPETMAALCLISLRQLERHFDSYLHQTPKKWLVELRCRLAQDLILQGYSTKAAAAQLKFASESHLCHAFKKVFGVSPQTFAP